MPSMTPLQLTPEGLLRGAVDALLEQPPSALPPAAALVRARALQRESERLAAASLASIGDLDERALFDLDGAGSTRSWLRAQPAGDHGQLALARRLRVRRAVRGALERGTINTGAAGSVCAALVTVDELEAGTRLGGGIGEDQVHGVLAHAVPDALRAWTGFDASGCDVLPDEDTDLRSEVVDRRCLLASVLLEAAEGLGLPVSQRLEPVFTLMARALSPNLLAEALSTIVHALEPVVLEDEAAAFERQKHVTLTKRTGRGWDLSGVLDDEDGQWLDQDLLARLRLLRGAGVHPTDAHEAPEDGTDGEPTDGEGDGDGDGEGDADDAGDAEGEGRTAGGTGAVAGTAVGADRFGAAGPGLEPLPWSPRRDAPVEGRPDDPLSPRKRGYAAFRMLLRDLVPGAAPPGTGSPPPAHLTVVVRTSFLAGEPGAPHPELDGRRLTELTRAATERLGCDSLISAVILDAANRPLAASGTHRSFSGRERRALRAQWGGLCAVNCCGLPGTIPHHVEMFSRTGVTRIADGVPFCEGHHHDVHDGKRTLRLRDGRLVNEDGWVTPPPGELAA